MKKIALNFIVAAASTMIFFLIAEGGAFFYAQLKKVLSLEKILFLL